MTRVPSPAELIDAARANARDLRDAALMIEQRADAYRAVDEHDEVQRCERLAARLRDAGRAALRETEDS